MARPTNEEAAKFFQENVRSTTQIEDILYSGLHLGPSGAGKTTSLGTMPKPMVILDAEGGTTPLRKTKGVDVIPILDVNDFKHAMQFLEFGKHKYKSIALDGLAKFQSFVISNILDSENETRRRKNQPQVTFVTQELWGVVLQHTAASIEWLQVAAARQKCHLAVSVLQTTYTDEERGIPIAIMPDLKGSIRDRIAAMFDVVVYHATKEEPASEGEEHGALIFRALTKPYGIRVLARDRWNVLDTAEVPDLASWIEKIQASANPDEDEPSQAHTEAPGEVETTSEDDSLPEPENEPEAASQEPESEPEPAPAKAKAKAKKTKPETTNLPPTQELADAVKEWFQGGCEVAAANADESISAKTVETIVKEECKSLGYESPKAILEDDNAVVMAQLIECLQQREHEFMPGGE